MENNILKKLEEYSKQTEGLTGSLEGMADKIKNQLTPEQQKQLNEKLGSTNIDEVMADFKSATNSMSNFMTDK